jgi:hypothetical protein
VPHRVSAGKLRFEVRIQRLLGPVNAFVVDLSVAAFENEDVGGGGGLVSSNRRNTTVVGTPSWGEAEGGDGPGAGAGAGAADAWVDTDTGPDDDGDEQFKVDLY